MALVSSLSDMEGSKLSMSNTVKVCRCLSKIFLNQSITVEEFFLWLSEVLFLTSVSILWGICLLIRF